MKTFNELTKGQQKFVDQMTRKLLVDWCIRELSPLKDGEHEEEAVFIEYAKSRSWLSADGKVLSGGWATATSFLKR